MSRLLSPRQSRRSHGECGIGRGTGQVSCESCDGSLRKANVWRISWCLPASGWNVMNIVYSIWRVVNFFSREEFMYVGGKSTQRNRRLLSRPAAFCFCEDWQQNTLVKFPVITWISLNGPDLFPVKLSILQSSHKLRVLLTLGFYIRGVAPPCVPAWNPRQSEIKGEGSGPLEGNGFLRGTPERCEGHWNAPLLKEHWNTSDEEGIGTLRGDSGTRRIWGTARTRRTRDSSRSSPHFLWIHLNKENEWNDLGRLNLGGSWSIYVRQF